MGLNIIELYASKIAALIGRTTVRDIFDAYKMLEMNVIKKENMSLLKRITIFYIFISNETYDFNKIIAQFEINIKNINFSNIKKNLIPLLNIGAKFDYSILINTVFSFIDTFFKLDDDELEFVNLFSNGKFNFELIFDKEIAEKLYYHPMVLWKLKNM